MCTTISLSGLLVELMIRKSHGWSMKFYDAADNNDDGENVYIFIITKLDFRANAVKIQKQIFGVAYNGSTDFPAFRKHSLYHTHVWTFFNQYISQIQEFPSSDLMSEFFANSKV